MSVYTPEKTEAPSNITLFLAGDVMTGRGIDQVLLHPSLPRLYESYVTDARDYLALAEAANGRIPWPVPYHYIWGDALEKFQQAAPDIRIINLETAVTASDAYWKGKGINYRMNPGNISCLTSADIDICVLANNHVLDWCYPGLEDTLATLHAVNINTAGAGKNLNEARAPAIVEVPEKGRVIVFSYGHPSSGIPLEWTATTQRSGIAVLEKLSEDTARIIAEQVNSVRTTGDIVVVSIHWGGNWGYKVPQEQRLFAHQLIDNAGVDIIHGHSSHHPKAIEVYHGKPILYGCGDLLNDYEGIQGYEVFRDDLTLMYFPTMNPVTGQLLRFEVIPMKIRQFRLNKVTESEQLWLMAMLNREGNVFGTRVEPNGNGGLDLYW